MNGPIDRLRDLLADGSLDLPPLGGGRTARRWGALTDIARDDLSVGRLAEAHADAVQILAEAGRPPGPGCVYGVWASEHPRWTVTAETSRDTVTLRGSKAFCTGAGLVDRALISVRATTPSSDRSGGAVTDDASILVDLDVSRLEPERIDRTAWTTAALADTATAVIDLDGLTFDRSDVIGGPGWYVDRPGFWDGAIGPAACWAGGAMGLVDLAVRAAPSDPHAVAHLGALAARSWELRALLDQAGAQIDQDQGGRSAAPTPQPNGHPAPLDARRVRALAVRHLVDMACADIQDRFARAMGPRSLAGDPAAHERDHALSLYRRQCHAERDLETLGHQVVEAQRVEEPTSADPATSSRAGTERAG